MAHVKMDDDLVILIEAIESNGTAVDTLMYRHIWQIDARLKHAERAKGGAIKANKPYIVSEHGDDHLAPNPPVEPKPPLIRHVRAGLIDVCNECGSSMVRKGFFNRTYSCIHSECNSTTRVGDK